MASPGFTTRLPIALLRSQIQRFSRPDSAAKAAFVGAEKTSQNMTFEQFPRPFV
jgi:hypothetical protein